MSTARHPPLCRVAAALFVTALSSCKEHEPPNALIVPHATTPIAIDGDWDESDWATHALRGQFHGDDGALARPSSEIRLLRDPSNLIVALYAADEDIASFDAFDLGVGALHVRVDAKGNVSPSVPGISAAVGYDEGTLDDPRDDDEEWVVELTIPISTMSERVLIQAIRCDVPKDGVRRCGAWKGTVSVGRRQVGVASY